ncbi:MAG TPA: SDR family oxidoreductase [Candidatus Limnocylindria bacterium]|jgi:short-subunit dehydrogenase|nr:SDR family oxidoreductase [Candidatus Limnocylindria bacterium]
MSTSLDTSAQTGTDTLCQPVVMITGASSGLGLATARQLLAKGDCRLILTARSASIPRFAAAGLLESDRVRLLPLDVALPDERAKAVIAAEAAWGQVDVLVNNAGVAYRTVAEHIDDQAWQHIMEVNCRAPLDLTTRLLPGMRQRRMGRIINISSVGGMMAMPTMALYSAAKFALEGLSESLWYEVRPWGIDVVLVEPGFIHSESFRNTLFTRRSFRSVVDDHDPYHAQYHAMSAFIERLMEKTIATPEGVAKVVVRAIRSSSPPLRIHATIDATVFGLMRRFLPRGLYHRFLYACLPHVRAHALPENP